MHHPIPSSDVELCPLIMTAVLDDRSWQVLDTLRQRYFPSALNKVPAHVTLFHALPGGELRAFSDRVAERCSTTGALAFEMTRTRFLGRGVAYEMSCGPLVALRDAFAAEWRRHLTAQDRNSFKPHATLQNKVSPEVAREAERHLSALLPLYGTVEGLRLWHYRGGPWAEAGRYRFAA